MENFVESEVFYGLPSMVMIVKYIRGIIVLII